MKNLNLNIEGLEEKETLKKVRRQLSGIIGVKDTYINDSDESLKISYDDRTSEAEIRNHLQNNGYKVK